MTYCQVSIDGAPPVPCEFSTEFERVDVSMDTLTEPDPGWEYTDRQGHYHSWATDQELPTLIARTEHRPCDGVHLFPAVEPCEGYDVTLYACSLCGEDVEPGTVTRHGMRRSVPGMQTWTVVAYDVVRSRDPVSLRIDAGQGVAFGFAVPTDLSMTIAPGGSRGRTTLVGSSRLGWRPADAPTT